MATILTFNASTDMRRRPTPPPEEPATIIIFPGIRYESAALTSRENGVASRDEAPVPVAPEVKG